MARLNVPLVTDSGITFEHIEDYKKVSLDKPDCSFFRIEPESGIDFTLLQSDKTGYDDMSEDNMARNTV